MSNTSTTSQDKRDRRRKVAALLAGGLVVGVGTAATLAAWNDSEFATSSFTAGTFNLKGQVDSGSGFTDHNTTPGGTLTFTAPFNNLTPTDVVYAPYGLVLADGTTNDADVALSLDSTNSGAALSHLTYSVVKVSSWGCNAAAFAGGTAIASNASFSATGSTVGSTTLAKPAAAGSDGVPAYLCFKVTADSTLGQSTSGTATWKFTATSK